MSSGVDHVQREFARMTMEREVASNQRSQTEGKIYKVEDGTVAEFTSTSAAHPRRKSPHEREHVASVTKRRVFTRDSPAQRASRTSSRSTSPHQTNAVETGSTAAFSATSSSYASPRTAAPAYTRPLPSNFGGSMASSSVASGPTSNTKKLQPVDMAVWVKTPQRGARREESYAPYGGGDTASEMSVACSTGSRRSVNWGGSGGGGGSEVIEIEPSRVSPLGAIGDYTHVTYVTKSQLRRMRHERNAAHTVSESIRSSSVPRLDSLLERRRLHGGRGFAPAGGADDAVSVASSSAVRSSHSRSGSSLGGSAAVQPSVDLDEARFYTQGPIRLDPRREAEIERLTAASEASGGDYDDNDDRDYDVRTTARRSSHLPLYESQYQPQAEERSRSVERRRRAEPAKYVSPSASRRSSSNTRYAPQEQLQQQQQGTYVYYSPPPQQQIQVPVFGNESSLYSDRRSGSSGRTAALAGYGRAAGVVRSPYRSPSTPRRVARGVPVNMAMPPPDFTLKDVASMLARSWKLRGDVPRVPRYAEQAFALLKRGTYLIKYAATGNPHERFFALRVRMDKNSVPQPCLVWSLHAESTQTKEEIHLLLLAGVGTGVMDGDGYRKSLVSNDLIKGPFAGSQRPTLPTDFALNLTFVSTTATRQLDLLALDDQTFRCWLLVCDYLLKINRLGNGLRVHDDEDANNGVDEDDGRYGGDVDPLVSFYRQQRQQPHMSMSFRDFRRDFVPDEAGSLAPDTPRSSVGGAGF